MNRRDTLAMLLALGAVPLSRSLPAAEKIRRIGFLVNNPRSAISEIYAAFLAGMRDYGYIVGGNLVIEFRTAEGRPDRLAGLARELVQMEVE